MLLVNCPELIATPTIFFYSWFNMASSHRVHFFHLIWSTKGRKNLILPKMQKQLYTYIGGVIKNSGGSLLQIGGIANHIHLLIEISNLDKFSSLVRNVKSSATSWLKREFSECSDFSWQDGFGSYSVSFSQLDKVKAYIANQEEHHKTQTFEQEYEKFLIMCGVQYDKRYLYD